MIGLLSQLESANHHLLKLLVVLQDSAHHLSEHFIITAATRYQSAVEAFVLTIARGYQQETSFVVLTAPFFQQLVNFLNELQRLDIIWNYSVYSTANFRCDCNFLIILHHSLLHSQALDGSILLDTSAGSLRQDLPPPNCGKPRKSCGAGSEAPGSSGRGRPLPLPCR